MAARVGGATGADLERVTRAMSLRQLEVLALLGEGRSNKDIARHLDIAERTVKAHATRVFELLDVANRTQAVLVAQKLGLLATA
jgi:ATP/maltotriose-dependent transcriptional regulator MalT